MIDNDAVVYSIANKSIAPLDSAYLEHVNNIKDYEGFTTNHIEDFNHSEFIHDTIETVIENEYNTDESILPDGNQNSNHFLIVIRQGLNIINTSI